MNRTIYYLRIMVVGITLAACNNDTQTPIEQKNNTNNKKVMVVGNGIQWAKMVESRTNVNKPEEYQDEYWETINQEVDYNKIFNTLIDAVLSGKKKAYDIVYDDELTIEQVKEKLGRTGDESKKLTANDLSAIRTRESWTFDEENFTFEKKVTRIDLLLKKSVLTDMGEIWVDTALFYIKLDE